MGHCDPREGKTKTNFDKFFCPKKYVSSLEPLLGCRFHGIWRSFQWYQGKTQIDFVTAQLHRAQVHFEKSQSTDDRNSGVSGLHNRAAPFGSGFTFSLDSKLVRPTWVPDTLLAMESEIAHSYEERTSNVVACHFGCSSKARLKTQNLVPVWRGAQLGDKICTKCHTRLIRELNDSSMPLVVAPEADPNLRQNLQGPCVFGCQTSAFSSSFNKRMQWHRVMEGSSWQGVSPGDILCNACYNGYRYHQGKRGPAALPREEWQSAKRRNSVLPALCDQQPQNCPQESVVEFTSCPNSCSSDAGVLESRMDLGNVSLTALMPCPLSSSSGAAPGADRSPGEARSTRRQDMNGEKVSASGPKSVHVNIADGSKPLSNATVTSPINATGTGDNDNNDNDSNNSKNSGSTPVLAHSHQLDDRRG